MKVLETKKKKKMSSEAGALIFNAIRKANEEGTTPSGKKDAETKKQ